MLLRRHRNSPVNAEKYIKAWIVTAFPRPPANWSIPIAVFTQACKRKPVRNSVLMGSVHLGRRVKSNIEERRRRKSTASLQVGGSQAKLTTQSSWVSGPSSEDSGRRLERRKLIRKRATTRRAFIVTIRIVFFVRKRTTTGSSSVSFSPHGTRARQRVQWRLQQTLAILEVISGRSTRRGLGGQFTEAL